MKERLDVLLVKRNLAESREKAKAIIMSGNVFVEDQREDKAGTTFPEDVKIEVRGHVMPYVSRGGLKLEKAIKNFDVSVEGKVCTDVGSSTGGFTDCMLQNGAVKVYAVDVATDSLHGAALRQTCCEYGTHQHPPCDSGTATGASRFFQLWMFPLFLSSISFRRCRHHRAGGGRCLPCKAAV